MIYNFAYQYDGNRQDVLNYLKNNNFKTVIDIGYSGNSWSSTFTTHYVDIVKHNDSNKHSFIGNISEYDLWTELLNYVDKNGKFDFAICSHTLEDISSPQMVCKLLPRIAKEGYVAVPSKYAELTKQEQNKCEGYNGYIHHRWLFNKENDKFVAYPKLVFMEYLNLKNFEFKPQKDLHFFWKDTFELNVINNDYLGPSDSAVCEMYINGIVKN